MTIAIYSNLPAPHQVPLAREIADRIGVTQLWFVCTDSLSDERRALGWPEYSYKWIVCEKNEPVIARKILQECDVLFSGNYDFNLFSRRMESRRLTIYGSERWLKGWKGLFRFLSPRFVVKAIGMARLLREEYFFYFAYGINAARDMARIVGLCNGRVSNFVKTPRLEFEKIPCGRVLDIGHDCESVKRMRIWGYSVEESKHRRPLRDGRNLSVLWVGRMMRVKKVDTIIKAIATLNNVRLVLIGDGPEKRNLQELAERLSAAVTFLPSMPLTRIREEMRAHDVYVFASGNGEGWGAVVNEALEEGMTVVGTYEAGSSATILPDEALFHAGDVSALRAKLANPPPAVGIGAWSLSNMAGAFVDFIKGQENA